MTDFAALLRPDRGEAARSIALTDVAGHDAWLAALPPRARAAVSAQKYKSQAGHFAILPGAGDDDWSVAIGVDKADAPDRWALAAAAARLPEGAYRIAGDAPLGRAPLGWLLAQHRFDRYRTKPSEGPRTLLIGEAGRVDGLVAEAEAIARVRDMVDTGPEDMGPAAIEDAVRQLARTHAAEITVTTGDDLAKGYPLIHAVGRAAAAHHAPRLIELTWGKPDHPRIAIVGKGVTFDSGGLDIKPASGMRLMKKDMGGAAHALSLAGLIMGARLPVRLHLLIPAVENAISGGAFRPGDVLRGRVGISVEIGNTDAEGRLILADALTRATEDDAARPELLLDFATLTGAARVALGPDLPALFATDDALADALLAAGTAAADPLWRLPLWAPYADYLKSEVADIANAGDTPFAGTITAALFLRRFVPAGVAWAHLDVFAWRPTAKPGRPKGGDALGLLAAWDMLRKRYGA